MSSDRTEKASPRRRQKATEDGDRPRSRDLLSAAGLLAGTLCLGQVSMRWMPQWKQAYGRSLALGTQPLSSAADADTLLMSLRQLITESLMPFGLVLIAAFSAIVLVGVAQNGGFAVRPKALAPKWGRFNPASNLKHIVSGAAFSRLGKTLLPVCALLVFALHRIVAQSEIAVFSLARLPRMFEDSYGLLLDAGGLMLAWSIVDYAIEWRSWEGRLKMSKQEMREEYKESEGNPQMKGRIRSLQRQMRRRKIRADVSRATVVITNPTHYAVALSFDFDTMDAPKVLAKGRDLFAAQIKDEARWAGVPIIENPPLARSLYRSVEAGQNIPANLYAAVAAILAYLYRQEMEKKMRDQAQQSRAQRTQAQVPHGPLAHPPAITESEGQVIRSESPATTSVEGADEL
ncbi:MAG: EscU/YscU/HrcU family type III secretion system export apparatus switch protein [Acidobacteriaceae bacterium]